MTSAPARAVTIYNPAKISDENFFMEVSHAATRHGYGSVEFVETTPEDAGFSQSRDAVAGGADVVLACGGDGTVRAVAAGLRGSDTALGILPAGTGNILARNVGISLELNEALEIALSGYDDRLDICTASITRADGHREDIDFVVMAGIGIDAQMILNTDDDLKDRIGFLAYAIGVVKSLRGGNRIKLSFRVDERSKKKTNVHSLIVGNCGQLMGNIVLMPDARPNDGVLDVVTMRPTGVWGWASIASQLFLNMAQKVWRTALGNRSRETSQPVDSLRYFRGRQLSVKLREPELFEVDGEEVGDVIAFHIAVHHHELKIRVPGPLGGNAHSHGD